MGSVNNPKTWVPYVNTRDCSQGFCSMYCPQWCYIIFPPPPPHFDFQDNDSGPSFSPLVIAIIGILASSFLVVSYYAIISKYCRNRDSSSRRENHFLDMVFDENRDPSDHGRWNVSTNGLDEAMIKAITVFKYKKGDGLFEGTDCSVCLSEFQEDENLRLLPKCSHAFHVTCIDTWLKSHSNCPLCRATIVLTNATPLELLPPLTEAPPRNETFSTWSHPDNVNFAAMADDIEIAVSEQHIVQSDVSTTSVRAHSDSGNSETGCRIIDIREDEGQQVRRSVSMDHPYQGRLSIADILRETDDEYREMEDCKYEGEVGTSRRPAGEMSRSAYKNKVLHCVTGPVAMKRSFSSGRLAFSKRGRGRNILIPL